MIWLIQGFFYEHLSATHFHGVVFNAEQPGARVGTMQDTHGKSGLSEIHRSGRELTFIKKYAEGWEFKYTFYHWHDNIWVGKFTGDKSGQAFCVLTEVDYSLYDRDVGQVRINLQQLFKELAPKDLVPTSMQDQG